MHSAIHGCQRRGPGCEKLRYPPVRKSSVNFYEFSVISPALQRRGRQLEVVINVGPVLFI